jgi:hypothetical protein
MDEADDMRSLASEADGWWNAVLGPN